MVFLFTERTDDDVGRLLCDLDQCSCRLLDPRVRKAHQNGRKWEKDIWYRTCPDKPWRPSISLAVNFFRLLMTALNQAHVRSVAKRKSPIWPTCPDDLMSFGPNNLAHGLLQWSRFILDTLLFKMAGQILRLCGALVLPAFIASQFTHHVIDAGRRFCDHVWDVIRRPHPVKSKQQDFSISFECQTDAILSYFLVILDDHIYQTQMDLLEGYEVKSVQLFSLLAYLGGDDRLGPRRMGNIFVEKFQRIGARLYRVVEMYFSHLPDIPVFPATFDDVEPYFERSDAAYSDMEFTLSMVLHNMNLGKFF